MYLAALQKAHTLLAPREDMWEGCRPARRSREVSRGCRRGAVG